MATLSSILAWRIPWTEESGGLQSMESQRVGHDWVTNTFHFHHGQNQIKDLRNSLTWSQQTLIYILVPFSPNQQEVSRSPQHFDSSLLFLSSLQLWGLLHLTASFPTFTSLINNCYPEVELISILTSWKLLLFNIRARQSKYIGDMEAEPSAYFSKMVSKVLLKWGVKHIFWFIQESSSIEHPRALSL